MALSLTTPPTRIAKRLARAAGDLLFPRCCVHCGEGVEDSRFEYLCADCAEALFVVEEPACRTCGHPFFGVLAGARSCPHCVELDPEFEAGKTLFLAKGPGRSILHELKYRSGFYVLGDLRILVESHASFPAYIGQARLVPVPLHPAKLRERGYNQSERIARLLCAASGGKAVVDPVLERRRYTRTQTRLSRKERHRNVKNAFALSPQAIVYPDDNYIVIDDVFTTGSTLNACCRELRKAGVHNLRVATMGHG